MVQAATMPSESCCSGLPGASLHPDFRTLYSQAAYSLAAREIFTCHDSTLQSVLTFEGRLAAVLLPTPSDTAGVDV